MTTTKLRIHTWPDKILRKKTKRVEKVDERIRALLDEMLTLMRVSGGVGLAANQAGIDLQLIVIETEGRVFKLANPVIVKNKGSLISNEGCLSFPGLEFAVKRHTKVWVKAVDEHGKPFDYEAEGLLAIVFQHELDHINGITFIDRGSFWQKLKARPMLARIAKETKAAEKRAD